MKIFRSTTGRKSLFVTVLAALLLPALCVAGALAATAPEPDRREAAIKRGEAVFRTSCQACHSLKYSGYEAKMTAESARNAFGKVPPDLNLMTKARGGGSRGAAYIAALLAGYDDTPEKNSVFPNIAMPRAFSRDDPELARKAGDVSAFLDDAADPSQGERRSLGRYVLGYMVFLGALLYALNRRTWKGIRKNRS